ncbi:TIGR04141 family sporadically distributed protein [Candidatus Poribacteria bacterium]|nr:TIGR04141 family sporadically distributed protein [Candidatus Poribacteria bacterium]
MAKFNLYKIIPNQKNALITKLESVGLKKTCSKNYNGFTLEFYFSNKPDLIDIWWVDVYKDFLSNMAIPKNEIYFATLLIYNSSIVYAVSLGKSHFYLKNFCDLDFGLNLAERIIDETNLKIKNSKFYKSRKNKIITTYQKGSEIDFDSGESMHYIKAKTIDETTWGQTASFGHSAQFSLEIQPNELPLFINKIEEMLKLPIKIKLPKVVAVQDQEMINKLDHLLAEALVPSESNISGVNLEEITLSGVDFIFPEQNKYSLYIKGNRDSQTKKDDLTLEKFRKFVLDKNIDLKKQLNLIMVKVYNEYGRNFSKPVKEFLDFVEEKERFCLIDGRWHQFNQSYIDFLKNEVDKIEIEKKADVSEKTEDEFNKNRIQDGYINCDKVLETIEKKYKVEKLDLYKDKSLLFVKIGDPRKMNYNIDQSTNVIKLLQNNQSKIKIDDTEKEITTICLWLIFDRRTKIEKLSDTNSLIFHMKLIDWKKIVQNAGYKPVIYISQKILKY